MEKLKFRQIHLDFHNSPLIYNIGENFNPEKFAKMMKNSYVNSVTFFAKCHHGMSYYPTKIGKIHPSLKIDLLGLSCEYLHKEEINCCAYISVGWDEYMAFTHPEYLQISPSGKFYSSFLEDKWKKLCLGSKYIEYVLLQTEEIIKNYDVDGIFFDIVFQLPCLCSNCLKGMKSMGLNPEDENDIDKYRRIVEKKFMEKAYNLIKSYKNISVFFNSRLRIGMENEIKYYTHFEIESLPTGGWSYNHFPIMAKYFSNFDKEYLSNTARFNLSWGDFGGIKEERQLEYEILRIISNGGKCSIGDQMNPDGTLEEEVYYLIRKIYKKVYEVEEYYKKVKPYSEIGIFSIKEPKEKFLDSLEGCFRILLQTHCQFSVITEDIDFNKFKLIIFPDFIKFNEKLIKKTKKFLKNGGKIILSYDSGLTNENKFFIENIEFISKSQYRPDYFQFPGSKTRYVMYEPGNYVRGRNCKWIGKLWKPYFNRKWDSFSSHCQTPYEKEIEYPAILMGENFSYIWAPIFLNYINYGNTIYLEILEDLIESMIEREIKVKNLPQNAEIYYLKGENCFLISILYYPYQKLTKNIDLILSKGIAKNVEIRIKENRKLINLYKIPSKEKINFNQKQNLIEFRIDEFEGFVGIFGEFQ